MATSTSSHSLVKTDSTWPPARTRSAGSSPRATAIHRGFMTIKNSSARSSSDRGLEEVDGLLASVPHHRRLGRFGASHHLAGPQHELAWSDQADGVHLGRRREDAKVGPVAWLQPVAVQAEGAGRVASDYVDERA